MNALGQHTWLAFAALGAAVALQPAQAERLVDGIAAQVDDKVVLVSEVLGATGPQEAAMREAGAPESAIRELRANTLERLIEDRLLERIIEQNEMRADDEEVNRTIEQIAAENGLSVEQLYASVVYHGLTVEAYRKQIRSDIERRNLVHAAVGQNVEVSEDELRAGYAQHFGDQSESGESVRVRQILRAVGGPAKRSEPQACAEAREARARIAQGEAFEQVAAELSEVAPRDGGDIGWLPVASIAPWMSEALAGLAPGEVSEVLSLPFGCTVLQLVERRELAPVSFEQARPLLEQRLTEQKIQAEYRDWVEGLRERSFIARRGYFGAESGLLPTASRNE